MFEQIMVETKLRIVRNLKDKPIDVQGRSLKFRVGVDVK